MSKVDSNEIDIIVKNSVSLINIYCSNLFEFITKLEFGDFIKKAYSFVDENNGTRRKANFLSSFFELAIEHAENNSTQIRIEYETLNFLLGEGLKMKLGKKFRNLVKSSILNFSDQSILDVMGELAACITLSKTYNFDAYEHTLQNGKSIDFVVSNQSSTFLIEVLNIKIENEKYEEEKFKNFITKRICDKHKHKSQNLSELESEMIIIFPIIYGLTQTILREQNQLFASFESIMKDDYNIKCFNPYSFCQYNQGNYIFKQVHEIL
ncbi:hypothetical protein [Carboxylicivirga taeanensis]|uniref:hypothetical protein n=1 Tax=Carboxylicivirga taeanensis TaxID=1416875 RepID=UPI003F6DD44A